MRILSTLTFVLALASTYPSADAQTRWYVDATGTPPGAGTPGDPFTSIQYAIAQPTTVDGDALVVLPGVYQESIDFLGKALLVGSAQGPEVTILLGDPLADPPRSVVTFASGESADSVLRGFTVSGGKGTPSAGQTLGGGIFVDQASPVLVDLVVEDNAAIRGGGLYARQSALKLVDCELRFNRAAASGGALHLEDSGSWSFDAWTVERCTFLGNWTEDGPGGAVHMRLSGKITSFLGCDFRENVAGGVHGGGGIDSWSADIQITDSRFTANRAAKGGALALSDVFPWAFVERSRFIQNEAYSPSSGFLGGGAVHATYSLFYATECWFQDNRSHTADGSSTRGGAVAANEVWLSLSRCVFTGNSCLGGAGALNYSGSSQEGYDARIWSSTLFGNQTTSSYGAAVSSGGDLRIRDSIVWNGAGALFLSGGGAGVSYTNVQGGYAGLGNMDRDPLFWDPAGADYHLRPDSPCIDAGDPAKTDPDGSRLDMGAFPFDPSHCPVPVRYCAAKTNSAGCLPRITYRGRISLSGADDFRVDASSILNQTPVFLFWGTAATAAPFAGGLLCVAAPRIRTAVQGSGGNPSPPGDCSGTASFHFGQAYLLGAGLQAGHAVHAQYWYRDPAHLDGTALGLTDGLRFWICP